MTYLPFWLWMPALGFEPWMVLLAQAWSLIYQFWIHTERIRRLPRPLEAVLNTPSHHRVHHGSNEVYLDRNYGGILIVWDKLFGTYAPEGERVRYGLTKNIHTYNPVRAAFHEYVAMWHDMQARRRRRRPDSGSSTTAPAGRRPAYPRARWSRTPGADAGRGQAAAGATPSSAPTPPGSPPSPPPPGCGPRLRASPPRPGESADRGRPRRGRCRGSGSIRARSGIRRHAHSGRDERLHDRVVVALVGDLGDEPGPLAAPQRRAGGMTSRCCRRARNRPPARRCPHCSDRPGGDRAEAPGACARRRPPHRHVRIVLERVELEVVEDGHVVEPAAERGQRVLGLGLRQAEADAGVGLPEPRDRPGDDGRAGAREADQPQLARLEARERCELALRLLEPRHRGFRVSDEQGRRRR